MSSSDSYIDSGSDDCDKDDFDHKFPSEAAKRARKRAGMRARKRLRSAPEESIPRDGAACLVLVPARGGEPRRMQAVAPDASLILGRDYAEGGAESPPSDFFAVCPNEKCSRISRRLVRIETRSEAITVANLAKKDTQRVLLDGVVVKFDAPVTIKETAPLRLGDDVACQDGGDVRAYIVTPTDDQFLLPVDDGSDFADDNHEKKRDAAVASPVVPPVVPPAAAVAPQQPLADVGSLLTRASQVKGASPQAFAQRA